MSLIGNILGVRMNIMIGNPVLLPMPMEALAGLSELEIMMSDCAPSGFKLVLQAGRTGLLDFLGASILEDPRFAAETRVVVTMIFDISPTVIFDGLVSKRVYRPGSEPGKGTLTLLGDDLSTELDREVKQVEHTALDETMIAIKIAGSYPKLGLMPAVFPPKFVDPPIPIDRVPQQRCSDWAYLKQMARRHGYDTYVDPGPAPGLNQLYWGPPVKPGIQQKALSINMGPGSDAYDVEVWENGDEMVKVEGQVKDRQTGKLVPIYALMPSQTPMGLVPAGVTKMGNTRKQPMETSGLSAMQAQARAQSEVDCAAREAFRITGTIDSASYNDALKARDKVDLRGAGARYNGTYKVASVRHLIKPGSYQQQFSLTRSEAYSALPGVRA
ncbi:hypothetical protein [Sphingomonas sp. SUN039]|uniref:hypothetical protein n=1 Tax=Sphingomonas sp. SUN039 TaxID=2937787 RepID=UPI002164128A|nr:hypothetical protein [Sphingomonas sp. SUN039]UVO55696.1 hypothetical protein M0209_16835 [Sphingomonas sp. SUN039]